jgi:hypothetical protein
VVRGADFGSHRRCNASPRAATEAVRDAKRAKLLDVKCLDNGDRVFYVGTGEDETTQRPSKTPRTGTR